MVSALLRSENDLTFEEIFSREYPRVVAIARRVVGTSAAEDVAQEVFASFARSGPGNGPRAAGWLHTAAVHVALNAVRARKRQAIRELADFRLRIAQRRGGEQARDPQQLVLSEQERAQVREAMLRVAPRDAEILALRYGGLSYRDVASALRIDVSHVGMRLARAERALRREIEREPS